MVPMRFRNDWTLDLDLLADAIGPKTRALFVMSPSNPTGWTATRDELAAMLALARRHGLWIIADETYARFWYGEGERAPSFFDVMESEDLILFVNTFSKNWAMTGWRIGWIAAHPSLGQVIENMIQYSTSGVAQFMQRAGVVALSAAKVLSRIRSTAPGAGARSRARRWLRPVAAASRFPQARSTCSSPSRMKPIRAHWRCVLLMLRGSGWRPAPRSEPAGRDFCACVSPATPRNLSVQWGNSPQRSPQAECGRHDTTIMNCLPTFARIFPQRLAFCGKYLSGSGSVKSLCRRCGRAIMAQSACSSTRFHR